MHLNVYPTNTGCNRLGQCFIPQTQIARQNKKCQHTNFKIWLLINATKDNGFRIIIT